MATFLTLPEKNNTSILSDWYTRAENFTNSILGIAGVDYPKQLHINTGSWTIQAIELVYDDILRFDKGTYTGTTPITSDNFNKSRFTSNMLWWIDNLAGMESDWRKNVLNTDKEGNTAYGYTQITKDTLPTALNRYTNHIDRYNDRHDNIEYPQWVVDGKEYVKEGMSHIDFINTLSYDQVCALTIVHAHSKHTNDFDWVKIQNADADAARRIYAKGHHTNPDTATLNRMEDFWIIKKERADTLLSRYRDQRFEKICYFEETCTVNNVIDKLYEKCIFHNGEEFFDAYTNKYPTKVLDTTGNYDTDYGLYIKGLSNKKLESGSTYKGFKYANSSSKTSFYFYRSGNTVDEFIQMIRSELSREQSPHLDSSGLSYNYDELCNTIDLWPRVDVYVLDWMKLESSNPLFLTPPTVPETIRTPGSYQSNPIFHDNGHVVMGLSSGNKREQIITLFHEVGGHAMHPTATGNMWGGIYGRGGDSSILSDKQTLELFEAFKNYDNDLDIPIKNLDARLDIIRLNRTYNISAYERYHLMNLQSLNNPISIDLVKLINEDFVKYKALSNIRTSLFHKYFVELPMANLSNLEGYEIDIIEEEFLSRIYSIMVTNRCITFFDDILPVMRSVLPSITIDDITAKNIDLIMRDEMGLTKRNI